MKARLTAMVLGAVLISLQISHAAQAHQKGLPEGTLSMASIKQANCGLQSLAYLIASEGHSGPAAAIQRLLPVSERGVNVQALIDLSRRYGYRLKAYRAVSKRFHGIPTPSIIHLLPLPGNSTGHFQVLEAIRGGRAFIYDAQRERYFTAPLPELSRLWSGVFLCQALPAVSHPLRTLSKTEAIGIYGGYDSTAQVSAGTGNLGGSTPSICGSPAWFVNKVNFNLVVADVPIWYQPASGPSMALRLTYNSRDTATGSEAFGNKWRFMYSAYLVENTSSGDVTVVLGDGRAEQFSSDGNGGYTLAYSTFNRLIKIGDNHFEMRTPLDMVYVFQIPAGSGLTTPYLVQLNNPRGQGLTMGYDSSGQLVSVQDALGQNTTLSYTDGKVTQVTDPFGRHADFEYTDNNLTRITDMGGVWAVFSYDANANLTGIEKQRGLTTFLIEGGGAVNSETYPAPGTNMGAHRRITIADPLGNKEEYYYNGLVGYGWYVSPKDYVEYVDATNNNSAASVPKTLYYYEDTVKGTREELSSVLYPEGRQITNVHDFDTGKVISASDSFGNTTNYTYNDMGRVASVTPELGAATTNIYDATNHVDLVESRIEGLGSLFFTYNAYHEATQMVDRVGKQTDWVYDGNGLVTSMTLTHDDHTITTEYTYYAAGHVSAYRLQQVTRAGQILAAYSYDAIGRIDSATDAAGLTTTFAYNNLNQITQKSFEDGLFEQYAYSSCCPRLIDSSTDRAGQTTFYEYDALERPVRIINPEGGQLAFEYDPNGNLITITNPNKNSTHFEYDHENRLTKRIWADGHTIEYRYDDEGRLVRRIDARGIRTYYTYDANDNLINTYHTDSTPSVINEYDDFNRLVHRSDATGDYAYTYYADGSVHTVDGPWDNDTLTYAYDRLGRRTSVTPDLGKVLSYSYDDLNRLTTVQTGARSFTYGYTGADPRVQTVTRPGTGQTTYTHADPLKRLTALNNTNTSDSIINRFDYAYADTGHPDQRSAETFTGGPDLSYAADQLTTYNYNQVDQQISDSVNGAFAYDDAGNLTRGYTPDGYEFQANYDAENRLSSITYTDGGGTVHRMEFVYRADNFLGEIKKFENGAQTTDTRILRDGNLALQDRDGSNQILREYTWGIGTAGGIGGLLSMTQGGQDYDYLYDGKGNVSTVLDATQTVAAAYRYDSFGRLLTQTGNLDQPFRFSTKRYLAGTGFSYYGYRYYAAAMGKWITRDPFKEFGGINFYGFVANNPVNQIDPYGMWSFSSAIAGAIGGGVSGALGGALIGTVAGPGIGTAGGAILGGLAGAIGGFISGGIGGPLGGAIGGAISGLAPGVTNAQGGFIGGAIGGLYGGSIPGDIVGGAIGGAFGGALTGGIIGSAIFPGLGTVGGIIVGGIAGASIGVVSGAITGIVHGFIDPSYYNPYYNPCR